MSWERAKEDITEANKLLEKALSLFDHNGWDEAATLTRQALDVSRGWLSV